MSDLAALIRDLGDPVVVVVGDVMLDRYVFGSVARISPEAPIPVLRAARDEARPGGAASVASNLTGLGARARLVGYVGTDRAASQLRECLDGLTLDRYELVEVKGRPTTLKTRLVAGGITHQNRQQLLRVDREDTRPYEATAEQRLKEAYDGLLEGADCVVISDYAKGVISVDLCRHVIDRAREAGVRVVVDPKAADYSRYHGASVITPNRTEVRAATGTFPRDEDSIRQAGRKLLDISQAEAAVMTLDKDGMALIRPDGDFAHIRTTPREVYDVTGAGDMVAAMLGLALGDGRTLREAVELANVAAGVEVAKIGAVPISRDEMLLALGKRPTRPGGILELDALLNELEPLRAKGRTVAFTNGCFDVLHAGHGRFLRAAAAEGDILVVGLNTDDSVRRLKGDGRPVNCESDRAELLAALDCVNFVVGFADDTPARLIERLVPDVLVKGEDWRDKGVVGREVVEADGGRVVLVPLLEGRSTTSILDRIRNTESDGNAEGAK